MTVIRPNSISGINSITANGGDINLFRADGTKADIPIVNNITAGVITATTGTFTGNLGVGGVLTYEDVTNIDSIGIITARSTVSIADSIIHTGDTNTSLRFPAADTITAETGGSERLRITSAGNVGINDNNPANQLVVKAPGGSGHCTTKVLSGDASTTVFLQSVQGTEGRIGVESNHPLAIYAGAAQRLVVGSTGIIDAAGQAGFYARLNSNINDKTGDGTYYTVQWDTDSGSVCYDQHSTFDTGTGLYTVPPGGNGIYQFSTAVCLSTDVYGRQGEAWFLTNTGLRVFFDRKYFPSATGTITGFYGSCLLKLNAGQTVGVQIFINGGSKNVDVFGAGAGDHISWFSGRKIA